MNGTRAKIVHRKSRVSENTVTCAGGARARRASSILASPSHSVPVKSSHSSRKHSLIAARMHGAVIDLSPRSDRDASVLAQKSTKHDTPASVTIGQLSSTTI
jgi:hypothetical protein